LPREPPSQWAVYQAEGPDWGSKSESFIGWGIESDIGYQCNGEGRGAGAARSQWAAWSVHTDTR
jgi:hypothetical protein